MNPPHPARNRFPWFRWFRRVLYGLTLFVAWKLAWRWYDIHKSTKEYEKAAAELDQSDPGWRWEEIEARREGIPDELNSAIPVESAARMLPRQWPSQRAAGGADADPIDLGTPGAPAAPTLLERLKESEPNYLVTEDLMQDLRAELQALAQPLAEASKVIGLPKGRYALTLARNPVATLVPHLTQVRTVAALLSLETRRRLQEEGCESACHAIRCQLNNARSVGDEPLILSQLVRIAVTLVAVNDLETVLARGELSHETLTTLSGLLAQEESDGHASTLSAVRGERAFHVILLQRLADGELDEPRRGNSLSAIWESLAQWHGGRPRLQASRAPALRDLTRLVDYSRLKRVERLPRMAALDAELRSDQRDAGKVQVALVLQGVSKTLEARDRQVAMLRCAQTALAAERFRMAHHGKWPQTIAELVPGFLSEVPIDPFTDLPPDLTEEDGVLVVSSPRSDDMRGHAWAVPGPAKELDSTIRFRLWRPESRGLPSD
jgi:hypothetical protein